MKYTVGGIELYIILLLIGISFFISGGIKTNPPVYPPITASDSGCQQDTASRTNLALPVVADEPPANLPDVIHMIVPQPVAIHATGGAFTLPLTAKILIDPSSEDISSIAQNLKQTINATSGYSIEIDSTSSAIPNGNIVLTTVGAPTGLGREGYELTITSNTSKGILLLAYTPEGLFRGIQTLRQLLIPTSTSTTTQNTWTFPTGAILDYPRFGYRGFMLDVARHFFSVNDVEKAIDDISYYKINCLHLHLTDDQGWRIQITSHPELTQNQGRQYYTQSEFAALVAYAKKRYVTIIPEIDMPGHSSSICSVFSQDCVGNDLDPSRSGTYNVVDDILKEIIGITPASYIHIGGDETQSLSSSSYISFINHLQTTITTKKKTMVGWNEIGAADISSFSVIEYWNNAALTRQAVQKGAHAIMAPGCHTYFNGLNGCSPVTLQAMYQWDPATLISGVKQQNILGPEAPLWTDLPTSSIEYAIFPRILALAEVGWSPQAQRSWNDFAKRVENQLPQLKNLGINYNPSF